MNIYVYFFNPLDFVIVCLFLQMIQIKDICTPFPHHSSRHSFWFNFSFFSDSFVSFWFATSQNKKQIWEWGWSHLIKQKISINIQPWSQSNFLLSEMWINSTRFRCFSDKQFFRKQWNPAELIFSFYDAILCYFNQKVKIMQNLHYWHNSRRMTLSVCL